MFLSIDRDKFLCLVAVVLKAFFVSIIEDDSKNDDIGVIITGEKLVVMDEQRTRITTANKFEMEIALRFFMVVWQIIKTT